MKKYLIRLADHLDKKGFRKEADYIDLVLKKSAELEEYENMTLEQLKELKAEIESMPAEDFEIMMSATNNKYNKILSAIRSKEQTDLDTKEQRELEGFERTTEKANEIFKQMDADEIFRQIDLDKLAVNGLGDIREIPYDLRADMVFEAIETMLQEEQTASEIISHIQEHLMFLAFTKGATSFVARDAIEKGWVVESEKDPGYYKIFS
jgi:hypothetical protein